MDRLTIQNTLNQHSFPAMDCTLNFQPDHSSVGLVGHNFTSISVLLKARFKAIYHIILFCCYNEIIIYFLLQVSRVNARFLCLVQLGARLLRVSCLEHLHAFAPQVRLDNTDKCFVSLSMHSESPTHPSSDQFFTAAELHLSLRVEWVISGLCLQAFSFSYWIRIYETNPDR